MTVFLPLLESSGDSLFGPLQRIGPVILTSPSFPLPSRNCYILPDHNVPFDIDQIIAWLDAGAEKVIVPLSWAKELAGLIPDERLLLLLDVGGVSAVSDKVRGSVSGVLLKTPSADLELITSFAQFFSQSSIYVLPSTTTPPSKAFIRELLAIGATLVIPGAQLTVSPSSPTQINIGDAFVAPLVSDRADGLFPTIVSSETGHSLGLVYSSPESIRESIITGKGVYQSRKHGLWRKGETSGASQDVVRISLDCDKDSLEFRVVQHGAGFCHLDRRSCFGAPNGIQALEEIIKSRFSTAPEGSYTKRLFDDSALLQSKIMEEADELCRAQSKTDVAAEAADLLYFALTKCVASGVSIWDIEQSLDLKAKRVTRRPGNAKPQWQKPPPPSQPHLPSPLSTGPSTSLPSRISMRLFDLAKTSAHERELLLQRPVLKSDEMISKVAPIVREVRVRGDAALLEFTAKFDKAKLDANVIRAPFSADIMTLPPDVRSAIDVAYSNIKRFHQAQVSSQPLVVETLPGVVCTRFSRPIARVGLYVPGGTAVLPSTALMLGIPAQVAGCKEVVIATPPRSDGTVSPEVAYVAHIVGATAILKAGGAQAVAAMAYGTETVPKVDKIFGPGNQWVTAAKMHVQNDTDALVSIDMPAGPSEVLVCPVLCVISRRIFILSFQRSLLITHLILHT